jgi:putative endonuclease
LKRLKSFPVIFHNFPEEIILFRNILKYFCKKSQNESHLKRKELGDLGEEFASHFLKKNNYTILERNYWCNIGEIDIIAQEKDTIVFVEVKSQYSYVNIRPERKIDTRKKKKLISLSKHYIRKKLPPNSKFRIDIIIVIRNEKNQLDKLTHYKKAL